MSGHSKDGLGDHWSLVLLLNVPTLNTFPFSAFSINLALLIDLLRTGSCPWLVRVQSVNLLSPVAPHPDEVGFTNSL